MQEPQRPARVEEGEQEDGCQGQPDVGRFSDRPIEGSSPRASGVAACGPVHAWSTSPVRPLTMMSTRMSLPYWDWLPGVTNMTSKLGSFAEVSMATSGFRPGCSARASRTSGTRSAFASPVAR